MRPSKRPHGQGSLRATAQNFLEELVGLPQHPSTARGAGTSQIVPDGAVNAPGPSSLAAPLADMVVAVSPEAVGRQYIPDQVLQHATQLLGLQDQPVSSTIVPAQTVAISTVVPSDAACCAAAASSPPAQQHQVSPATDAGTAGAVPGAALHAAPSRQATAAAQPGTFEMAAAGQLPAQAMGAATTVGATQAAALPGSAADTVSVAAARVHADSAHHCQHHPAEPTPRSAEPNAATPQPATPATATAAAARGASPSPSAARQQWTPLLDYIVHDLMQQPGGAPSREAVLDVLSNLVCYPNIYVHLNKLLRHRKVRTKLGSSPQQEHSARDQKHGISYLNLSCPQDIMHSDPLEPGGPDISCAAYLARWGHVLQYLQLPCVDILNNKLKAEAQEGSRCYKSFPLEHCLNDLSDKFKSAEDRDWPWAEISDPIGNICKGRMPPWVAELFRHNKSRSAAKACAAHGDATALAGGDAGEEVDSIAVQQQAVLAPHAVQAPGAALQQQQQQPRGCAQQQPAQQQQAQPPQPPQLPPEQQQAQEVVDETMLDPPTLAPAAAGAAAAVGSGFLAPPVSAAHSQVAPAAQGTPSALEAGHVLEAVAAAAAAATSAADGIRPPPAMPQVRLPQASRSSSSSDEEKTFVSFGSSSHFASAAGFSKDAFIAVNTGFNCWLQQLYPTKQERRHMKAALDAVGEVVRSRAKQRLWSVAAVHPVGSVSRKTSLRNSHDLDLLVELNVNNQAEGHFEQCRDDCLHTIQTVLCTIATAAPAAAAGSRAGAAEAGAAAVAASGWQLKPCLPHWLRLYHPVLDLQLDIHVCQSLQAFGSNSEERMHRLLQELISRASAQQSGEPSEDQLLQLSGTAKHLVSPARPNRYRTTLLTPWMRDIVAGFPQHCATMYHYQPDSLVTNTIRAVKAWSKVGLAHVLQQQAATSNSSPMSPAAAATPPAAAAAADNSSAAAAAAQTRMQQPTGSTGSTQERYGYSEVPPGYMWEIYVLYVFEQKLQQAKAAGRRPAELYPTTARNLQLFMDVLEAASRLLHPGSTDAIALYALERYTAEQCELFRQLWGPVGALCTPYIISPVDPSYNCTKHCIFKGWGAVADAAGELYQQMQAVLQGDMAAAIAGQPGGSGGGIAACGNAWEQLVRSSSLGPAVQAFQTFGAFD